MSQPTPGSEPVSDESADDGAEDRTPDGHPNPPAPEGSTASGQGPATTSSGRKGRRPRSGPKRPVAAAPPPTEQDTTDEPPADQPPADRPEEDAGDQPTEVAQTDDRRNGPMTAADYARTTGGDPASTSVMPRVQADDPDQAYATSGATSDRPQAEDDAAGPRQARLNLVHVDPWSVTKLAFVISVALMIVSVVAVSVFWAVLNITGVWGQLNETINSVLSSEDGTFDVTNYVGFWRVLGLTLVLSGINVLLMTALAAIGARLYNVAAALVGGIQVTFADRS